MYDIIIEVNRFIDVHDRYWFSYQTGGHATRLYSFSDVSTLGYFLVEKNDKVHGTDLVTTEGYLTYAGTRADCGIRGI